MRAACVSHFITLISIRRRVRIKWNYSLRSFIQPAVTSPLKCLNILILFPNTAHLRFPLNMGDHTRKIMWPVSCTFLWLVVAQYVPVIGVVNNRLLCAINWNKDQRRVAVVMQTVAWCFRSVCAVTQSCLIYFPSHDPHELLLASLADMASGL
jgi:hypothetical protein